MPTTFVQVIKAIVDDGDFFELKAKFARNLVIGFGRLNGYPVGFVANQPMFLAGSLDVDASDKAARFIRFCDAFNVPIITLMDVPGFFPGKQQEEKGIIRHGAKMLYAYAEATVPKITIVLRKGYGGAKQALVHPRDGRRSTVRLAGSRTRGDGRRWSGERALQKGDRTIAGPGKNPPRKNRRVHRALQRALRSALQAIRPGRHSTGRNPQAADSIFGNSARKEGRATAKKTRPHAGVV